MSQSQFVLYHNYWSICSIQTRYIWALRGSPKDTASDIPLVEKAIDIQGGEQLSEECLCEINPKGEVCATSSQAMVEPFSHVVADP